jgi:hypothetical protein
MGGKDGEGLGLTDSPVSLAKTQDLGGKFCKDVRPNLGRGNIPESYLDRERLYRIEAHPTSWNLLSS